MPTGFYDISVKLTLRSQVVKCITLTHSVNMLYHLFLLFHLYLISSNLISLKHKRSGVLIIIIKEGSKERQIIPFVTEHIIIKYQVV